MAFQTLFHKNPGKISLIKTPTSDHPFFFFPSLLAGGVAFSEGKKKEGGGLKELGRNEVCPDAYFFFFFERNPRFTAGWATMLYLGGVD